MIIYTIHFSFFIYIIRSSTSLILLANAHLIGGIGNDSLLLFIFYFDHLISRLLSNARRFIATPGILFHKRP